MKPLPSLSTCRQFYGHKNPCLYNLLFTSKGFLFSLLELQGGSRSFECGLFVQNGSSLSVVTCACNPHNQKVEVEGLPQLKAS